MKPITLWHRKSKKGTFVFNHIADGKQTGNMPPPKHPSHVKSWAGGEWAFEHADLEYGRVVHAAKESA